MDRTLFQFCNHPTYCSEAKGLITELIIDPFLKSYHTLYIPPSPQTLKRLGGGGGGGGVDKDIYETWTGPSFKSVLPIYCLEAKGLITELIDALPKQSHLSGKTPIKSPYLEHGLLPSDEWTA